MTTYWKCENEGCGDGEIYRFKGLCRSCTTYDWVSLRPQLTV